MGYRDFEDLRNTKIRNTNKLDYIASNLEYLLDFVKYIQLHDIGAIINRHVFKFTRLREEIIFLTVKISNSNGGGKKSIFKIAVNEKSFWNRFIVCKSSGERYNKFDYDTIQIIQYIIAKNPDVGTIRLRLTYEEKQKIAEYVESTQEQYRQPLLDYHLCDDSIIEIIDMTHYSKRTWCYFFNSFIEKLPNNEKINRYYAGLELGGSLCEYKTKGSEGFYDPSDVQYSDYRKLYEVPYVFEAETETETTEQN